MVRFRSQHEIEESSRDHFCFDTLLMWVKAVIKHYLTHDEAVRDWMRLKTKGGDGTLSLEDRIKYQDDAREALHLATRARHDMLSAAQQLFLSRNWALKRGLVKEELFKAVDRYRNDVASLRNMHQHQVEYFKGTGLKPDEWVFKGDAWTADASSTIDGKWGGRLDPKELFDAVNQLLPILVPLDPEMIERQKMFARIKMRDILNRDRRAIVERDIGAISHETGLSIEAVREQLAEIEAENR